MSYDAFAFMKFYKKKYGFNIVANEFLATVQGLWAATKSMNNSGKFLDLFGDKEYNGLHFWSNFEIGDLNWYRSKEYNDYFEHLDKAGGVSYKG
jgi:alpha 1,2-mannosyltransferase